MPISGDLLTGALSALAFIPCAMGSVAPSRDPAPRRREVVVNGKRVKTIDVHAHCQFHETAKLLGPPAGTPLAAYTG